jgi:hypothetical protein
MGKTVPGHRGWVQCGFSGTTWYTEIGLDNEVASISGDGGVATALMSVEIFALRKHG